MATPERGSSLEANVLLQDLFEKKQNLKRIASEVGTMASELRVVRGRMATQGLTLEQQTVGRQSAEAKANSMEKELELLHKSLAERNSQAISTASVADQYLRELVDVRAKLGSAKDAAEASAAFASTAQSQCKTLLKAIEKKNEALQEHENHVTKLGQQLIKMQHDLRLRDSFDKRLKEKLERLEAEIKLGFVKALANRDFELRKFSEELSARNVEHMAKCLSIRDKEIMELREEIKLISCQLTSKSQEIEAQIEKRWSADQELKKRVTKLEFWLQEVRTQTRKLQRVEERREKEMKDLRAQLWHQNTKATAPNSVRRFLGSSKFKILTSVSVVVLAFFARR